MRIVIDMQGAQTGSRFRGIGRYTISLVKAIIRNKREHEIILVLNGLLHESIESIRTEFNDFLTQDKIKVWSSIDGVQESIPNNEWRRQISELIREDFLISLKPDIVLVTSLFEGFGDEAVTSVNLFANNFLTAVILYDLIPLVDTKNYIQNKRHHKHYLSKINSLLQSDVLLAISEYTLNECLENLVIDRNKICNISAACDEIFKPIGSDSKINADINKKYGISYNFILYSGGADPRKNLTRLIEAYSKISTELRQKYQLVLVGKVHESIKNELYHLGRTFGLTENELVLVGYVPDDDLIKLLNLSKLFIFPSLYEGFGLPVLEAMSCGTPVICSDKTSLPEVIGNKDALFDPLDVKQISNKIEKVLIDESFRQQLVDNGIRFSKNFSWDISAIKALDFFENAFLIKESKELLSRENLIDNITKIISKNNVTTLDIIQISHSISLNQNEIKGERQILIDISDINTKDLGTGIQRVTRSVLKFLIDMSFQGFLIKPIYASMYSNGYRYADNYLNNMKGNNICVNDEAIEYCAGDIFIGLDYQAPVVVSQENFLMGLKLKGVRVLFVVYDLLPVIMPEFFNENAYSYHQRWLETLEKFDGVICISQSVANDYKEWKKRNGKNYLHPFTIDWFHLGADIDNSVPSKGLLSNSEKILSKLQKTNTFLMVGTIEPRKGHQQVLDAFNLIWAENPEINLVLVGKNGWKVKELVEKINTHPLLNKKLFWLNGISDEYLEKVYAVSTCLVAASYGEGFGLPLIEAAQHEIPIIARDIPIFREVAGEHAFYFKADEPEGLAKAIQNWLFLYEKQKHLSSSNMPWLTWEQSAKQLLDIVLDPPSIKV